MTDLTLREAAFAHAASTRPDDLIVRSRECIAALRAVTPLDLDTPFPSADVDAVLVKAGLKPALPTRIGDLKSGQRVTLAFDNRGKPFTEDVRVLAHHDDGSVSFLSHDGHGDYEWSAYRHNGRWVYGSSAERVRLLKVLT